MDVMANGVVAEGVKALGASPRATHRRRALLSKSSGRASRRPRVLNADTNAARRFLSSSAL